MKANLEKIHLLASLFISSSAGFENDEFFKGQKIVPKNRILVQYCHPRGTFLGDF